MPHGRHGPVVEEIEGDACGKDHDPVFACSQPVESWKRLLLKRVGRPILDGVERPELAVKRSSSTPA